jgi:hypothetical protein
MGVLRWVAENFQLWIAGLCIALIPVWVWYLTRKDQMARAHVETTRHRWESTSTFEIEFQKARSQIRLISFMFIAILIIGAVVIVCAHVVVR